jgi:hypothetical protein
MAKDEVFTGKDVLHEEKKVYYYRLNEKIGNNWFLVEAKDEKFWIKDAFIKILSQHVNIFQQ